MKKLILFIIVLFLFQTVFAYDFNIGSDKVIVVNLNENMVLYEKNADDKTQIASLTKIVTAITVIENTENLNEEVTITYDMLTGLDGYAKSGFQVGDKVTVLELLYALMLPSAADAAQALAIHTSGTLEEFANLMNQKVNQIGVSNTMFSNPVGMDDVNNYSTARDLYNILKYSLNNETFKTIFEANKYYINALDKEVTKTLASTSNIYNLDSTIIKGAKTGFTWDAGLCLASTTTLNNVNYMIINLNASTDNLDYINDPINLYNYYNDNYEYKKIVTKGQLLKTIEVKNSETKTIDINALEDKEMYLEKSFDPNKIEIKYDGIELITDEVKLNDKLGTFSFIYNGEVLYTYDAYLTEEIKYYNYMPIIITLSIVALIILIIIVILIVKRIRRVKYAKCKSKRHI